MKRLSLFTALLFSIAASAQTETSIRTYYTEVNKQINESIEQGFEGPLYNNQWISNKNGRSWPAVGNFSETTDFWYDDPPDHISASERNPKNVLVKVNITRKASHLSTNEEYLFKDGRLLFYFSQEGEEGNEWETRVYFNSKGIAFKSSVKANGKELTAKDLLTEEYKDFKPKPASILVTAKKYQDLFVKSML
ncbi:MAG TPA: hypothetical protein VGO58_09575 [Chitinophagaceae bacterium]|jgi:hypothetical protein|nr:hypothetical protein [Chitinophagaceae bacterium]